jgi:hypothetical protein
VSGRGAPVAARVALALSSALPLALSPAPALAQDGAYGRLAGDLALDVEAGVGTVSAFGPVAQARALYLATAGVYGTAFAPRHQPAHAAVGVELRPLFLGRFLKAMERGPSTLDLALDSIFLSVGARFPGSRRAGLELGSGFELPLLGRYDGLFLGARVYRTFSDERLGGAPEGGATQVLFTLGFRGVVTTHVVDVGDVLRR